MKKIEYSLIFTPFQYFCCKSLLDASLVMDSDASCAYATLHIWAVAMRVVDYMAMAMKGGGNGVGGGYDGCWLWQWR